MTPVSARMQQLKQMKAKEGGKAWLGIFFAELRHRLSRNSAAARTMRTKRLNMFAFENVVRHNLGMDLDVKLIRTAFRTVEDVFAHLSFNKLLHALVSSAIGLFATPMRVLQQNWRQVRSIKEAAAEKLFLGCEANMRTAADRMAGKLNAPFVSSFIANVKATNSSLLSREEVFGLAAKSRDFWKFELEYFFGRIFDLVLEHTQHTEHAETFPLMALIVLLSSCTKTDKTLFVFQMVDCDDDACLSPHEVLVYFQLLTKWSTIAKNDQHTLNLDGGLLNFELARQQAQRLADLVLPPTTVSDPHLLVNYGEIARALNLIDHLIPGIQTLRWLLPEIPPYPQVWDQIVQVRARRKQLNYLARRQTFLRELTSTYGLARPVAVSILKTVVQPTSESFWHTSDAEEAQSAIDSDDEKDQLLWQETEHTILRKLQKTTVPMDPMLELKANIKKLRLSTKKPIDTPCDVKQRPNTSLVAPRIIRTPFAEECANRAVSAIRGVRIARELSDSEDDKSRTKKASASPQDALRELSGREVETFESLTFGRRYLATDSLKPVIIKQLTPYSCLVCKAPHEVTTLKLNE